MEQLIAQLQPEMISALQEWISIPSVKGESAPGAPFGKEVRRALDAALETARKMGFEVRDFDGYAADVRMGPLGVNPLGILAHLDVVPAGDGWETDPFEPVIKNGNIYGRGTSDDKGPAVAALYAMYALKKAGIPLKREVRLILGCDEECGMGCMTYYMQHCDMPRVGFSPDANFPVINTEKGMLGAVLTAPWEEGKVTVRSINVGERTNVIPGKASAILEPAEGLVETVNASAASTGVNVTASLQEDGSVLVYSEGIPGHAAYPETAKNALGQMLVVMRDAGVTGPLAVLAEKIGMEWDGFSMGIRCSDETSGYLTCNLGILRYSREEGMYATLDMRCPILADLDALGKTLSDAYLGTTIAVDVSRKTKPHHVAPTSPLVRCLLDAYHEVTGLERECIATGGGTYARKLQEGVAFGSIFPGEEELAHQANEYMSLESLRRNVEIFARAIEKLQDK